MVPTWYVNKKTNDIFVKGPEILIRFKSNAQNVQKSGFRFHCSITEQHSQGNFDILMAIREKAANSFQL